MFLVVSEFCVCVPRVPFLRVKTWTSVAEMDMSEMVLGKWAICKAGRVEKEALPFFITLLS